MNPDLIKILSSSNKQVDNQKLMEYLAGELSPKDRHEIEVLMADSEFVNDAVEGLQQVNDKKNIDTLVENLNKDLTKKLEQKKIRKEKKRIKEYSWVYFAVALILILLTVTWFIINSLHSR